MKRYENMNTLRRASGGTKGAANGTVLREGRASAASEGAAIWIEADAIQKKAKETVSAPTFMAAAVLLSIDAFLAKKEGGAA